MNEGLARKLTELETELVKEKAIVQVHLIRENIYILFLVLNNELILLFI